MSLKQKLKKKNFNLLFIYFSDSKYSKCIIEKHFSRLHTCLLRFIFYLIVATIDFTTYKCV